MLAIALGLGSSVVWGLADFLGGIATRKLSLASVVVVSQAAGFAALLAVLAAGGGAISGHAFALGAAGGLCGAIGLTAFYAALAAGKMSIVSSVAACGALVPVALALAGGERPGTLALGGAGLALTGAVAASIHEYAGDHPGSRSSLLMAIVAAAGIGGFLFLIGRGAHGGHTLAALVGARVGSLGLLLAGSLATGRSLRMDRSSLPAVALVGLLDTGANGLFALATTHGYLSIVAVLGSVYPIVTVLLAQTLLRERITPLQALGVGAAITGVALVGAASV